MDDLSISVLAFGEENYALMWDEEYRCDIFAPTAWWSVCDVSSPSEFKAWMDNFCPTAALTPNFVHQNDPDMCRVLISFKDRKEAAVFKLTWYGR